MKSLRVDVLLAVTTCLMLCHLLIDVLARVYDLRATTGLVLAFDIGALVLTLLAYFKRRAARISNELEAERQRIARDLHDGLGFQLVTALSLARDTTEMSADVRLALELAVVELHSVVHSAQSDNVSIVDAMANLRYRLQPILDRQGLRLLWQVDEDIPKDVLVGPAARHFIRLVQEALSNVLQHSQATRLVVKLSCPPRGGVLLLEVMDNGLGLASQPGKSRSTCMGRGLANMKQRAEQIGAALKLIEQQGGGTRISLAVPLPCASV
jgi:two-component system sensor histidine kinase DevS